jgi:hypothetical protein
VSRSQARRSTARPINSRNKSRNKPTNKSTRKYLAHHAEAEASLAAALLATRDRAFGHVLVIPAYSEYEPLFATLASIPRGPLGPVLTILVVNQRRDASSRAAEINRRTIARLDREAESSRVIAPHARIQTQTFGSLLLLDHTRPDTALAERQGVGLARKIGCDMALGLWAEGGVVSPWIHCSDADVRLPRDYFERIVLDADSGPPAAVRLYDFEHIRDGDAASHAAALRYELYLRYYVLGLRAAGSPYAYHSISSTLAIEASAYAKVRGFPRRQAGEDFHVLNKLAKVGRVAPLRGETIALSGRVSDRVPFGTGRAITQELARIETGASQPAYDPRVFAYLKVWIDTLNALTANETDPAEEISEAIVRGARGMNDLDPEVLQRALERSGDGPRLIAALPRFGAHADLTRHLHENFDALRTLKLIHELREHLPSLRLDEAFERAPFIPVEAALREQDLHDITRLEGLCRHLAVLESTQ